MNTFQIYKLITLMLCAIFATASVEAKPDLNITVPSCVVDLSNLPVHVVEAVYPHADDGSSYGLAHGTISLVDTNLWLTAAHVIGPDPLHMEVIINGGVNIPLSTVYVNHESDIALLYGDSGSRSPLRVVQSDISTTQNIFNIGAPGFGGGVIVSYPGVVHGLSMTDVKVLTSAYASTGMSGGPVVRCVDGELEILGVISAFTVDRVTKQFDNDGELLNLSFNRNNGESVLAGRVQQHITRAKPRIRIK